MKDGKLKPYTVNVTARVHDALVKIKRPANWSYPSYRCPQTPPVQKTAAGVTPVHKANGQTIGTGVWNWLQDIEVHTHTVNTEHGHSGCGVQDARGTLLGLHFGSVTIRGPNGETKVNAFVPSWKHHGLLTGRVERGRGSVWIKDDGAGTAENGWQDHGYAVSVGSHLFTLGHVIPPHWQGDSPSPPEQSGGVSVPL
jgi:hypothetical protein